MILRGVGVGVPPAPKVIEFAIPEDCLIHNKDIAIQSGSIEGIAFPLMDELKAPAVEIRVITGAGLPFVFEDGSFTLQSGSIEGVAFPFMDELKAPSISLRTVVDAGVAFSEANVQNIS